MVITCRKNKRKEKLGLRNHFIGYCSHLGMNRGMMMRVERKG